MAVLADASRLVLNAFATVFQNELVSRNIVTWRQYDGEMTDRNNLSVSEQVGPRFVVTQTVNGVANLSTGAQDIVMGSELFVLNRTFGTSMSWDDFEKIRELGDLRENTSIQNAATQLAEQIDAYILNIAVNASNNWTGTPGNNVSTFDHIAAGYTRLKEEGVSDAGLAAVLSYQDLQALGSAIVSNNASLERIGSETYRRGFDGTVAGIPTMFTQQLPIFTAGTRTNGTVNGAGQNVNYSAVAVSTSPGFYMTQTLNVNGLGASTTIRDGDVFTIANVFAYDNRLQAPLPRLQQFRVVGDATASGAGAATLRIFPAIIVPNTGSGSDIAVNTANATVSAAPANGAAVTFLVSSGAQVRPRVIIQKEAIVVNTKDLVLPATGEAARKKLTKVPLSVRMWKDSAFATGEHRVRFDVALTANVRDRRRIVRING